MTEYALKDRPKQSNPEATESLEFSPYVRDSMHRKVASLHEQAVQMLGLFDDGAPRK